MKGRAAQRHIAVVFDFDDTLAPDTTSGFLREIGVDPRTFWDKKVQPLMEQGWDPVPAYMQKMIELSKEKKITRKKLQAWGRKAPLFPGVTRIFTTIRKHLRQRGHRASVEFYVISSGLGDVIRSTKIARSMKDIWASEFAYDKNGEITCPKNVVSFTDKTRFLFQVEKGIFGPDSRRTPFAVNEKVPSDKKRIPLDQMIIVGDGYTDIPCFTLIQNNGGFAIGVYNSTAPRKWGKAWHLVAERRVNNLAKADYRKNTTLRDSLLMAVETIANRIQLKAQLERT